MKVNNENFDKVLNKLVASIGHRTKRMSLDSPCLV